MKIRIKLIIFCFMMLCLLSCASQSSFEPPLYTDNWKVGALYSEIAAFIKGEKKYQELSPEAEKLYIESKKDFQIVKELLKSKKITGDQVMKYLLRDVNIYGVSPDVVNRLLEVIDGKDVTIAEQDAEIRELIKKDKKRKELFTFLETEKRIIDEDARVSQKERFKSIGTSPNAIATQEKIRQNLVKHKNLLEQTKIEKQYSFDDWYYKGAAEFEIGDYPAAITSFTKALKALENVQNEAGKAYTYNYRGTAYSALGRHEKALADYDMAIGLEISGHELPYFNKGIIVYNYLGQYEEAKINLNKAIVINPKYIDSYIALSEMNIIEGDYKSALDTIERSFSFRDKRFPFRLKTEDAAMLVYMRCLAMKLLNKDTSHYETEFNKILERDFTISQIFVLPESWFKNANIDEDTKTFIKEKTELLKKHLKKI